MLAGTGHTFERDSQVADAGQPLPRFAIPARLRATVAVRSGPTWSRRTSPRSCPGSDPALKGEYVVFTAHLDHLGIGKPINGDSIYNGAMDNASGIATMLDVAAMLRESGHEARRSVLFVAVTGEEKGLLGSKFFANFPTVAPGSIVADINTDMFSSLPIQEVDRLRDRRVRPRRGRHRRRPVDGDPDRARPRAEAERVHPKRPVQLHPSGIPSIALKLGFEKGSPEEAIARDWLKTRYHAPSDDLAQPVDRKAAADFDALVARLLTRVADRDARPRWKDSSFFKRFAP